jgi:hypothetical protein
LEVVAVSVVEILLFEGGRLQGQVLDLLFGKKLVKVDERHAARLDDHDFVIDPVNFEDFQ